MAPAHESKRPAILCILLVAALVFAACTSDVERQYEAAEQLRRAAAEAGFEWLETEALLNEALQLEEQGNSEGAIALIEKARLQAERALQQSENEAKSWRTRVVGP